MRTFTINRDRPLQWINKGKITCLLHVKEFTHIHLKLNQTGCYQNNRGREGKVNTVWFSTLLFCNKINQIINCTSTESISPIYWHHTNTYILPASNQSPFSILVHWNHPQSLKNKNRNWCLRPFPPIFFKLVYYKPGFLNPSASNTCSQGWKSQF